LPALESIDTEQPEIDGNRVAVERAGPRLERRPIGWSG
jgi:hypothetical protein